MLKIAFDKTYKHPLDENHRFPMIKYDLIPEQLLRENTCDEESFFKPRNLNDSNALLTHQKDYYDRFSSLHLTKKEIRPIGFPMSEKLVYREKKIAQGTIECVQYSIKNGISMNIAGGTHHAFKDRGEAFCMDVHQGNGTASIFSENKNVFTLSFHGEKNYPFKKEKSDLDIGFPDKTDDNFYLKKLEETLPKVIDDFEPDFIFYLAGVDVLENDKLGRLGLTIQGCKKRDKFVLELCRKNNVPIQISMGGGYSVNIKDILEAHSNTYRLAQEIFF